MKTKSTMLLHLKVTKNPTRFAIFFPSKGTLLKFIFAIYQLFPFFVRSASGEDNIIDNK